MQPNELISCECGGDVMHLIRDEEESIIECNKCQKAIGIEELWNSYKSLLGQVMIVEDKESRVEGDVILDYATDFAYVSTGAQPLEFHEEIIWRGKPVIKKSALMGEV